MIHFQVVFVGNFGKTKHITKSWGKNTTGQSHHKVLSSNPPSYSYGTSWNVWLCKPRPAYKLDLPPPPFRMQSWHRLGLRLGATPSRTKRNHPSGDWHPVRGVDPKLQVYKLITSLWFQTLWKILVNMDHFPKDRGENKKHLKPPPRLVHYWNVSVYRILFSSPSSLVTSSQCRL